MIMLVKARGEEKKNAYPFSFVCQLKRIELIEETYTSDKAKLQEIRQLVAKKNR